MKIQSRQFGVRLAIYLLSLLILSLVNGVGAVGESYSTTAKLASELDTAGNLVTVLHTTLIGKLSWVEAHCKNRFRYPPSTTGTNAMALRLYWPSLTGFRSDLSYTWNELYQIIALELTEKISLLEGLTLIMAAQGGLKNKGPFLDKAWLREELTLHYQRPLFSYQISGMAKTVRHTYLTEHTHQYYQVAQKLNYYYNKGLSWQLGYQENTASYSDWIHSNYWKSQWFLAKRIKFPPNYRWEFSYQNFQKEKGLLDNSAGYRYGMAVQFPFLASELKLGYSWRNYTDLSMTELVANEAEPLLPNNNFLEKKFRLDCSYHLANFLIKLKYFGIWQTYYAKDTTEFRSGFYASLTWRFVGLDWTLGAAPFGEVNRKKGYYQLVISL